MCYSEFNDIIAAVAAMDADVISIETSRSAMELLDAFAGFAYPNDIGPGVYDIHSPRVPTQPEMEALLEKALKVLTPAAIVGEPRLRPQDARLGRSQTGAGLDGGGGKEHAPPSGSAAHNVALIQRARPAQPRGTRSLVTEFIPSTLQPICREMIARTK